MPGAASAESGAKRQSSVNSTPAALLTLGKRYVGPVGETGRVVASRARSDSPPTRQSLGCPLPPYPPRPLGSWDDNRAKRAGQLPAGTRSPSTILRPRLRMLLSRR
jgi:hypothetical protein